MSNIVLRCSFIMALVLSVFSAAPTYAQQSAAEIARERQDFLTLYREGDAAGVTEMFDENATFAGTLGPAWLEGKEAIGTLWKNYFAGWPARNISLRGPTGLSSDPNVDFFNNETVAVETGFMLMYMGFGDKQKFDPDLPPVVTHIRYSITRVKTDDKWLIVNMNVATIPGQ